MPPPQESGGLPPLLSQGSGGVPPPLWDCPLWCENDRGGAVGRTFRSMLDVLSKTDRFKNSLLSGEDYLRGGGKSIGSASARIKMSSVPDYDALAWVPQEMKADGFYPERVQDQGGPQLLITLPGRGRMGCEALPFVGFGHILGGVRGLSFFVAWPVQYFVDQGISAADMTPWLCTVKSLEWHAFVRTQCVHFCLAKGDTAWIPFGWSYHMIALCGQELRDSVLLMQPFLSPRLAQQTPKDVLAFLRAIARHWQEVVESTNHELTKKLTAFVMEWMEQLSAGAATAQPSAVPALCDEDPESETAFETTPLATLPSGAAACPLSEGTAACPLPSAAAARALLGEPPEGQWVEEPNAEIKVEKNPAAGAPKVLEP